VLLAGRYEGTGVCRGCRGVLKSMVSDGSQKRGAVSKTHLHPTRFSNILIAKLDRIILWIRVSVTIFSFDG